MRERAFSPVSEELAQAHCNLNLKIPIIRLDLFIQRLSANI